MTSATKYLYRGVNPTLYTKLNGVLLPKVQQPFSASPRWDQSEWDNSYWGESTNNAVIEHQQHQAGLPTSGISTTPHISQAEIYATHGGKYSEGYVFVIDRVLCKVLKVAEFVVNEIVPYPSAARVIGKPLCAHPQRTTTSFVGLGKTER